MAPLTWRNVDSPSFASANQLYTLASELMNRGFNSASRGLDKFREITTDEQSARLMQDVMAATTTEAPRIEVWWLLLLLVLVVLIGEAALTRKMVQGGHAAVEALLES